MDTTFNRIKRKLEAAELQHLREHCSYLGRSKDMLEERLQHAEEQAEWYLQEWHNLINQITEEGQQPMLTKAGEVIPENDAEFIARALDFAIDFMAGFEDDPAKDIEQRMKVLRTARVKLEAKP